MHFIYQMMSDLYFFMIFKKWYLRPFLNLIFSGMFYEISCSEDYGRSCIYHLKGHE